MLSLLLCLPSFLVTPPSAQLVQVQRRAVAPTMGLIPERGAGRNPRRNGASSTGSVLYLGPRVKAGAAVDAASTSASNSRGSNVKAPPKAAPKPSRPVAKKPVAKKPVAKKAAPKPRPKPVAKKVVKKVVKKAAPKKARSPPPRAGAKKAAPKRR
jgi:hypothetical protein